MAVTSALDAVPETMPWPLYYRAAEARRPDHVLSEQRAGGDVDEERCSVDVERQRSDCDRDGPGVLVSERHADGRAALH
jgi:hypothetical protein